MDGQSEVRQAVDSLFVEQSRAKAAAEAKAKGKQVPSKSQKKKSKRKRRAEKRDAQRKTQFATTNGHAAWKAPLDANAHAQETRAALVENATRGVQMASNAEVDVLALHLSLVGETFRHGDVKKVRFLFRFFPSQLRESFVSSLLLLGVGLLRCAWGASCVSSLGCMSSRCAKREIVVDALTKRIDDKLKLGNDAWKGVAAGKAKVTVTLPLQRGVINDSAIDVMCSRAGALVRRCELFSIA